MRPEVLRRSQPQVAEPPQRLGAHPRIGVLYREEVAVALRRDIGVRLDRRLRRDRRGRGRQIPERRRLRRTSLCLGAGRSQGTGGQHRKHGCVHASAVGHGVTFAAAPS